jgi:WD40 repeat protein
VFSGTSTGEVVVWDLATSEITATRKFFDGFIGGIAVSNSNEVIAVTSGTADSAVILDATLELKQRLTGHHSLFTILGAVALSSDGGRIAISRFGAVEIWDTATGEHLHSLGGGINLVRSLSLSENGELLITGTDGGTVRVWSVNDELLLHSIDAGPYGIDPPVALSPDGLTLGWAEFDGTINLVSIEKLTETPLP